MRVTLIVPALFALSLVGGSALAEKPEHQRPVREPKLELVRARGDVVDRYDHTEARASRALDRAASTTQPGARVPERLEAPRTHGDVVDRAYQGASSATKSSSQRFGSSLPFTHTPQATQKQSERQHCSTAQDDCAANRANKFQGTHAARLETKTKDGATKYVWRGDRSEKSEAKRSTASSSTLTAAQQRTLIGILRAKMCAHAASQDGCGGDD